MSSFTINENHRLSPYSSVTSLIDNTVQKSADQAATLHMHGAQQIILNIGNRSRIHADFLLFVPQSYHLSKRLPRAVRGCCYHHHHRHRHHHCRRRPPPPPHHHRDRRRRRHRRRHHHHHHYIEIIAIHLHHNLPLLVSVEKVHLLDDSSSEEDSSLPTTFHLVENHPCRIRCISLGGYPPPNIELYIGHRDVTSEFLFRNDVTLTGVRGVRSMTYRTERWTSNYLPRADDNEQLLRCVALVPGLSPVIRVTTLDVDCKCTSTLIA